MSEEKRTCQAMTKAGRRCKNAPQADSAFCHVHQPARPPNFGEFVEELNQAAANLRAAEPEFTPPPFFPPQFVTLDSRKLRSLYA